MCLNIPVRVSVLWSHISSLSVVGKGCCLSGSNWKEIISETASLQILPPYQTIVMHTLDRSLINIRHHNCGWSDGCSFDVNTYWSGLKISMKSVWRIIESDNLGRADNGAVDVGPNHTILLCWPQQAAFCGVTSLRGIDNLFRFISGQPTPWNARPEAFKVTVTGGL